MGLANLRALVRPLAREALQALYPRTCPLCAEDDGGDGAGCAAHRLRTSVAGPRCGRCAHALAPVLPDGATCAACRARPTGFARAACLLDYRDDAAREWILALKHGGRRDLADPLGRLLGARLALEPASDLRRVLVPVPLHATRRLARGYDQALLLARAAGASADVPVACALSRTRATPPQGATFGASRRANVRGAFGPRRLAPWTKALVRGAECWLVDDVLTSGETCRECARQLRRLGAARINVLALARA